MKLFPGDLNPNLCPSHPTSTYTCRVTITPKNVLVVGEWVWMNKTALKTMRTIELHNLNWNLFVE